MSIANSPRYGQPTNGGYQVALPTDVPATDLQRRIARRLWRPSQAQAVHAILTWVQAECDDDSDDATDAQRRYLEHLTGGSWKIDEIELGRCEASRLIDVILPDFR